MHENQKKNFFGKLFLAMKKIFKPVQKRNSEKNQLTNNFKIESITTSTKSNRKRK